MHDVHLNARNGIPGDKHGHYLFSCSTTTTGVEERASRSSIGSYQDIIEERAPQSSIGIYQDTVLTLPERMHEVHQKQRLLLNELEI
jgi:hypothetical protein